MFKRALIYLIRNRSKTFQIGFVMFVVSLFFVLGVFGYTSLDNHVNKSTQDVRPLYEVLFNSPEDYSDKVCSSKYVVECYKRKQYNSVSDGFEFKGIPSEYSSLTYDSYFQLGYDELFNKTEGQDSFSESSNIYDITTNDFFTSEQLKSEDNFIIINEKVFEANDWQIGDSIEFEIDMSDSRDGNSGEKYSFEIAGTYSSVLSENELEKEKLQYNRFKPKESFEEYLEQRSNNSDAYVSPGFFNKINDVSDPYSSQTFYEIDEIPNEKFFKKDLQRMTDEDKINGDVLIYFSGNQDVINLINLKEFILFFLVIMVVVVSIILFIIISIHIQSRKYEFGVLLSLGMKKKTILMQIIVENTIVALSCILFNIVLVTLSFDVIKKFVLYFFSLHMQDIKLYISFFAIPFILVVILIVILLACLVSSIFILRMNPKKILMGV